ncbi:MAG TPA: rod shape-determining protein RodA [Microthrixaceae bacterium]|nr:rod shape-determining protein RodA [Microthrixaceae bacterium]
MTTQERLGPPVGGGLGTSPGGGLGRVRRKHDMTAAWRHVDFVLCALVGLATVFGLLMIYSATHHGEDPNAFISKQVLFVVIGVVAMGVAAWVDYERLADWSWAVYLAAIAMLGLVLVPGVGSVHKNIRAWFDIGPIQIQPAELAKIATIIALAAFLGRLDQAVRLRHLAVCLVVLALPMGLIMLQPDLGTTLVFVFIGLGMLIVGGVPARYLVVLALMGLIAIFGILNSDTLDQYQKDRLISFVTPDRASEGAVYNTREAQKAIASGGLTGKGLFDGPQTAGGFVPEQQTDFIFTVPAEELGFAGAGLTVLLLAGIVWRIWRTAQLARDRVGQLICVGVLCMVMFHVFENIGMNLGIMPVTGIPLPFFSYGGSSTITTFIAMGLVLNVHMRRYS